MPPQLDTAIGFIIIMSIVSLLIMVATQILSAFLGLRGLNLADAIETMLHKLVPTIHEDGCRHLISEVLTHPSISDSTMSLKRPSLISRMLPSCLRLRWGRATAVRPDELGQVLRAVAAGPLAAIHNLLPQIEKCIESAILCGSGLPAERINALKNVQEGILVLKGMIASFHGPAPFAPADRPEVPLLASQINLVFSAYAALGELSVDSAPKSNDISEASRRFHAELDKLERWEKKKVALLASYAAHQLNSVLAEAERDGERFEKWFNSAQDRAQQWFALHTRVVSVIGAIVAAFVLQLDTFQLVGSLSRNPTLRAKLIARADSLARREEALLMGSTDIETRRAIVAEVIRNHPEWGIQAEYPGVEDPVVWLSKYAIKLPQGTQRLSDIQSAYRRAILDANISAFMELRGDAASDSLQLMPEPYPVSDANTWFWPYHPWRVLSNGERIYWSWPLGHLFGILVSAALLSLGSPFWFNLLKKMAALRPALAGAVDENPKQTNSTLSE